MRQHGMMARELGWTMQVLAVLCCAAAQPLGAQTALPPRSDTSAARAVTLWATGGGGIGTRGMGAIAGGQLGIHGWVVDARYLKSMRSGSSEDRYVEQRALMVGRLVGRTGRQSLAVGVTKAKSWEDRFEACTSDCWFGNERRVDPLNDDVHAYGFAAALHSHSPPLGGFLALGLDVTAFFGNVSSVGLNVVIDFGRVR